MRTALALILACLALCSADLPGHETDVPDPRYVKLQEFKSPATGETFNAYIAYKDAPVTDYDYDRCPHPVINLLPYTLVIDPSTGFVAYPEYFETHYPWEADALKDILGEPRFNRDTPPGMPWAGAYAWEMYENAAKLSAAADAPMAETGNWWLLGAWSVRLDVISGNNEFDQEVEAVFNRLPKRGPNPGELIELPELQHAAYWEDLYNTGQLHDVDSADLSLAMAWLYRSRGELVPARQWLGQAVFYSPGVNENPSSLYNYLDSSIKLETEYLENARDWFRESWNNGELTPVREAGVAYLLGEICRRLGDFPKAVFWYDTAAEVNLGALHPELIRRQRDVCNSGRGY